MRREEPQAPTPTRPLKQPPRPAAAVAKESRKDESVASQQPPPEEQQKGGKEGEEEGATPRHLQRLQVCFCCDCFINLISDGIRDKTSKIAAKIKVYD